MAMLYCENLSMSYDGGAVVKDLSFQLNEGDFLCIVGANGSGKSTLMKGILGLIKPSAGRLVYNGISRNQIGYMPQQSGIQRDFPASVYEVIMSGCISRRRRALFYSKADKYLACENIKALEINQLRKTSFRDLSGGQQQRVLLARALCAADKLLMLDEPMTGLDPNITSFMYSLLQSLNREQSISIIMISHDIRSAVQYGNKILHLNGNKLFFGDTAEYTQTDEYAMMTGGIRNA